MFQWSIQVVCCIALFGVFVTSVAMAGPGSFTSDDFNVHNLKRPLWSYIDAKGDASMVLLGTNTDSARVSITVPAGVTHDLWINQNDAPRIMQSATNTDFQIEVKFFSGVVGHAPTSYATEGVIVGQDDNNLIRFDFTSGNGLVDSMQIFGIVFSGGFSSPSIKFNKTIGAQGTPMWMRINRTGNTWTVYYSTNGTIFTLADSFSQTMTVTQVGAFAGNAGDNPAAFTCNIDYFFNTDSPIASEDGARNVPDTTPPYIYNVKSVVAPNALGVSWMTDEPATGAVNFGETTGYGNTVSESGMSTIHGVMLSALATGTTYNFQATGADILNNQAATGNFTQTTGTYVNDTTSVSDDFGGPSLDATLWSFVNPRSDATQSIAAKQLSIAVPGGVSHNVWTTGYNAPRVMQAINPAMNTMEFVVKFTAPLSGSASSIPMEGLVFEQDARNLMRFDLSHDGSLIKVFAASFTDGLSSPEVMVDQNITPQPAPMYIRVQRGGAWWSLDYSFNGTTWTNAGSFYHIITPNKVGIFAGNEGPSPQAFTCTVDYFQAPLPAKTLLTTPVSGALDVPTPVAFAWDPATKATTYRLQVSTGAAFTTTVFDSIVSTNSKQVNGLANSTVYYWRTRGINATGLGSYSAAFNFTTAVAPPGVPTLVMPANNAIAQSTSPLVIWNRVASAASYRLQLGLDSTFATGLVINDSTITDTTKSVVGLANNTRYFWRVRAKNAGGTSAFSTVWAFTTISATPSVPVLVSPANGAVNQPVSLTLRWNRTNPPAVSYRVQLSTDAAFLSGMVVDDSTVADTSRLVSGLLNNTPYYWRVNGKTAGGTGAFSSASSFTTIVPPPSAPSLVSPANGATGQTVTLTVKWTKPLNASTFRLQVSTDSTFGGGLVVNDSTLTDTSRVVSGLVYNARYFWRVNAKNVGGTGPFSTVWRFSTLDFDPNVPRPIAPANGATGLATSVTLRWGKPVGTITSYHLQVGTDSTFAGGIFLDDPAVLDTSKVLNGLTYVTKYYWRVNADGAGGTSPYSPVWNFSVGIPLPSQVVLVSPADGGNVNPPGGVRVIWRASGPLVTKYWFDLAVDSNFVFVITDSTLTDTTKLHTPLLSEQVYFWRVKAKNAGGWGPFSVTRRFTTHPTSVADQEDVPKEFGLSQNYPNPFNPSTQIEFAVPMESHVMLEVYNLLGERVATLVDERKPVGRYTVQFNAANLASGLYFYKFSTNELSFIKKMVLVK